MAGQEGHSKQDLERVKKALMRVLEHGRASKLAIQGARRMHCDVCAENVQPKLPRPAIPRQDILSLPHWERFHKISEMFEHRVPRHSFPDDQTTVVGHDGSRSETSISRRLAAVGT